MLDFEQLLNALHDEVAVVPCPVCQGAFKARVGELREGTVLVCEGCAFEVPLAPDQTPEDLLNDVKSDLAVAFKKAFKAIEDYAQPPEERARRLAEKRAIEADEA